MKVRILNGQGKYISRGFEEVYRVCLSPDKLHAVIIFHGQEDFVAARIVEEGPDGLTVDFVDGFCCCDDELDFRICSVDWSWMKYGFCKLYWTMLESGSLMRHRFYFDRELYLKKRAELNGEI